MFTVRTSFAEASGNEGVCWLRFNDGLGFRVAGLSPRATDADVRRSATSSYKQKLKPCPLRGALKKSGFSLGLCLGCRRFSLSLGLWPGFGKNRMPARDGCKAPVRAWIPTSASKPAHPTRNRPNPKPQTQTPNS